MALANINCSQTNHKNGQRCFCPLIADCDWTDNCHAKSGPGKKWPPGPILAEKNGPGGSTFFCQKWTSLAKSGPGPILSRKKWTRSSFTVQIQAGPFLAGEKSGPGPVSLPKSRQVHFWQGKKVDPVQFPCRNPGRSIFGRGKKWTRSSFPAEIQAGPFLAGEKSGPGPVSLPKSRQVHFWQGKKVDPVQFPCRNPGRSIFGRGKKWTRSSFPAEIQAGPFLAGEKSGPGPVSLPKSRQVHFWQGKKVDPVQFPCRNPGRSIFGRGKKWTRSSFPAEIQAGPFLAGEKSGPGPVSLAGPFLARGKKWTRSSFAAEI